VEAQLHAAPMVFDKAPLTPTLHSVIHCLPEGMHFSQGRVISHPGSKGLEASLLFPGATHQVLEQTNITCAWEANHSMAHLALAITTISHHHDSGTEPDLAHLFVEHLSQKCYGCVAKNTLILRRASLNNIYIYIYIFVYSATGERYIYIYIDYPNQIVQRRMDASCLGLYSNSSFARWRLLFLLWTRNSHLLHC
jgi:hypothetical protein